MEALLLLGSVDDAVYSYAEAVSMPDVEPAWIASTRKQALQIAGAYEDEDIRKKRFNLHLPWNCRIFLAM